MAGLSSLRIKTTDWQVASDLYASTVQSFDSKLWSELKIPFNLIEPSSLSEKTSFKGKFQQGKIYALIIPKLIYWTGVDSKGKAMDGNLNIMTSASQAQAGSIQFHVPYDFKDFKLYSNLDAFKAALDPYRTIATAPVVHWDAAHPAPALLLELSGHFGPDAYTVVSPASVKAN